MVSESDEYHGLLSVFIQSAVSVLFPTRQGQKRAAVSRGREKEDLRPNRY